MGDDRPNPLVGTWKLVSLKFEIGDTGESGDIYGPDPLGYLILTDNGRMMAVLTSADRAMPKEDADYAAIFRSTLAYSGRYRIEGDDQFVTTVDVAWNPEWIGSEQVRFFNVDGDALSIRTAPVPHPMFPGKIGVGVLIWRKAI
jgi:hypothetical protein